MTCSTCFQISTGNFNMVFSCPGQVDPREALRPGSRHRTDSSISCYAPPFDTDPQEISRATEGYTERQATENPLYEDTYLRR